jgi:glycosyltransferase involved in cell wall biosynthesis
MRVLVDAVAAWTGGGASRIRELARTLPVLRPDDRFLFVIQPSMASEVRSIAPAVQILVPPRPVRRPPARLVWEHGMLPRSTRGFAPEVVFSPFNVVPTWWPSPKPKLALIVSNLQPYSPELRAMYRGRDALRLELLRRLTDRSIADADRVFLLSNQAYDLIGRDLLARSKAEVIPMAPPTLPNDPPPTDVPKEPFFVVISDLVRFKGIELVVDALGGIKPGRRPLVLVCGRPQDRPYATAIERRADRYNLGNRFQLCGPIEHVRVMGLLSASRGCILPSRFENPSRVPLEAMAAGAPIVASDIAPFREACGDIALYFPLDRPAALGEHLLTLANDAKLAAELGQASRDRIRSMNVTDASVRIVAGLTEIMGTT